MALRWRKAGVVEGEEGGGKAGGGEGEGGRGGGEFLDGGRQSSTRAPSTAHSPKNLL